MSSSTIPPMDIPAGMLKGKNVAVTGGTTGIGRSICIGLAKAGANLCVLYLDTAEELENAKTLQQEVAEICGNSNNGFVITPGDVSKQQTAIDLVAKCVEEFGAIDVMVANAGINKQHDFLDTSAELYYEHIRINLDGIYFAVQEAGRQMQKQGTRGSIICTGSIRSLVGGADLVPYTATKGGVLSIVQASAVALGKFGIRVNCLMPGGVETPLMANSTDEEGRRKIRDRIPMGRIGIPEDLAGPAIFLASDLSRWCNGSQILCDGGQFVNLE